MMPIGSGGAASAVRASRMDQIEQLLEDIFLAYSLPSGVMKKKDSEDQDGELGPATDIKRGSSFLMVDAIDAIGWQQLCVDCALDESDTALFKQLAKADSLEFPGFLQVIKAVARQRYGGDDRLEHLMFHKLRYARGSVLMSPMLLQPDSSPISQQSASKPPKKKSPPPLDISTSPRMKTTMLPDPHTSEPNKGYELLHGLHKSAEQGVEPMLRAGREVLAAFEKYRDGKSCVSLQRLSDMFSDLHLLPAPVNYMQVRSQYQFASAGEDGLNYEAFVESLTVLAQIAYPGASNATEELIAAIKRHLTILKKDGTKSTSSKDHFDDHLLEHTVKAPFIQQLDMTSVARNRDVEDDVDEALGKTKSEAQRRLDLLAEDFAAKQIALQKQQKVAEQELEAELQIQLAQNAVLATRQKRTTPRPSTERLDVEEKLSALDRLRVCRPSRRASYDEAAERLEVERDYLLRRARALKARDDARHIAEAESIQDRNAKKISANGDKLRRQLAQESARLSAALHTEMQKKHEEIRTWYETATRLCWEKHVMKTCTPRKVIPSPRTKGRGSSTHVHKSRRPVQNQSTQDKSQNKREALMQVQLRLQAIFSSIYNAFVFLDINDRGFLDHRELDQQLVRIIPEVSVDQIMMEILGEIKGSGRSEERGISLELFIRHLSWHPVPSLRRALLEAIHEARQHRRSALAEFYSWQFSNHRSNRGTDAMTLDDLALLPSSRRVPEPFTEGSSSARSPRSYTAWKNSLRLYNNAFYQRMDMAMSSSRRRLHNHSHASTPRSGDSMRFDDSPSRDHQHGETPSHTRPRPWISDARKEQMRARLVYEKRKLAVRLLETERKLMQATSRPQMRAEAEDEGFFTVDHAKMPGGSKTPRGSLYSRMEQTPTGISGRRRSGQQKRRTGERELREFVGPMGPYREVTPLDRLAAKLKNDMPASVAKCVTHTGLWCATPPQGLCLEKGERSTACWRNTPRGSNESHAPQHKQGRSARKDVHPNGNSPRDVLIDECLELVSGLMLLSSQKLNDKSLNGLRNYAIASSRSNSGASPKHNSCSPSFNNSPPPLSIPHLSESGSSGPVHDTAEMIWTPRTTQSDPDGGEFDPHADQRYLILTTKSDVSSHRNTPSLRAKSVLSDISPGNDDNHQHHEAALQQLSSQSDSLQSSDPDLDRNSPKKRESPRHAVPAQGSEQKLDYICDVKGNKGDVATQGAHEGLGLLERTALRDLQALVSREKAKGKRAAHTTSNGKELSRELSLKEHRKLQHQLQAKKLFFDSDSDT